MGTWGSNANQKYCTLLLRMENRQYALFHLGNAGAHCRHLL